MTTRARCTVRETPPGAGDAPRAGQQSPRHALGPTLAVRFPLGRLLATPGALHALAAAGASPLVYFARHAAGDWGEVDAQDRAANDRALRTGERLLSAYTLATGARLWVITEADRSTSTALLPEEY